MKGDRWDQWWRQRGERGLREAVWTHRDPIGLRDFAGDEDDRYMDEYDSYLAPIAAYLRTGADLASLGRLLDGFADLNMGLGRSLSESRKSAQALIDWYQTEIAKMRPTE